MTPSRLLPDTVACFQFSNRINATTRAWLRPYTVVGTPGMLRSALWVALEGSHTEHEKLRWNARSNSWLLIHLYGCLP